MKNIKHYIAISAISLLAVGCAEERESDFRTSKPDAQAEYERLSAYDVLTAYAPQGFKIGNTITPSELTSQQGIYSVTITNFNEVEVSGILQHNNIVDNAGNINFDAAMVADVAKTKGIRLFGPALLCATNINSSFLSTIKLGEEATADTYSAEGKIDFNNADDVASCNYRMFTDGKPSGVVDDKADGGTIAIEADPKGEKGQCLHISGASISVPQVTFNLNMPSNRKNLGLKKMSFDIMPMTDGSANSFAMKLRIDVNDAGVSADASGSTGMTVGEWNHYEYDLSGASLTEAELNGGVFPIEFGPVQFGTDFYVANMVLEYEAQNFGFTEYPLEQRHDLVMPHVKQYVDTLVSTYGEICDAWVVAERPVSEPENYWRKNLGDKYASEVAALVKAQNSGIKTFVSEADLSDPLIMSQLSDFVKVNPGVDGINVVLTTNDLDQYYFTELLTNVAKTGLLVRLSGLKVLGDSEDEAADLKYYIEKYREIIPSNQQYGITFSDARAAMWDAGFNRKAAYGSVADALK
ncbi:MAG: hypothetical protein Q4D64_00250 [Prevotellaceae bacterium]|nr:hypothetical protein [Prevotellaceae bacterium]